MKRFWCVCQHEVFFDSTRCVGCQSRLGYSPELNDMLALTPVGGPSLEARSSAGECLVVRQCANTTDHDVCNWLVPESDSQALCRACRLNTIIPNLSAPQNLKRWRKLEAAKRRLLYSILQLGLSLEPDATSAGPVLSFAFLEDQRTNERVAETHVHTGYAGGRITVNAAEADDEYLDRERRRQRQSYRTVLGHFRHESGHYFWEVLIAGGPQHERFRELFGDERRDYAAALESFYAESTNDDWPEAYVSGYAQSHPFEDWAECWSHVLHAVDTLETANAHGLTAMDAYSVDFAAWFDEWLRLSVTVNELNRAMGMPDAYPFVLSDTVARKLRFTRSVIDQACRSKPRAATR